jgi:hypothetical protein
MKKGSLSLRLAMVLVLLLSPSILKPTDAKLDDRDNGQMPEIIRLVERIHDFTIQDFGTPGLGLGDRIVFTSDLFDEAGNQVGRDGADCVVVRIDPSAPLAEQQVVQCTITVELADGQITVQGLAQGTENLFAVTGGTGAYRKARGEAFAKDRVPLEVADITITLFR